MHLYKDANAMAKHYAETLENSPNAWGQHVSPIYGQSHNILNAMDILFGSKVSRLAIDKAIKESDNA